ncbi:hypothetical protein ACIBG8_24140 [Nonomuraea sp. NPDC050556]|uniref:hypothetical protein n=1 Tax=Nonomuraea sp. NPDC050556 TaxID=3364369 RepID=UPI0037900468
MSAIVLAAIAWNSSGVPIQVTTLGRFHQRQLLEITPFNGRLVIAELRTARRLTSTGFALGIAACLSEIVDGRLGVEVYPILAGWLAGTMLARVRPRPRFRMPLGLRLASPALVAIWRVSAALSLGIALSAVLRSFWIEVPVGPRLWAVAALGVVLAVHLLVRDLATRPLPLGPADMVSAEVALRAWSARRLLAAGAVVALWTAVRAALPGLPGANAAGFVLTYGVAILAWAISVRPWSAGFAADRPGWRWATGACSALLAVALTAGWLVWGPIPSPEVRITAAQRVTTGEPVRYASLTGMRGAWELFWEPGAGEPFPQAALTVGVKAAPFAISGDGHSITYLDTDSRKLVHLSFSDGARREVTGALEVAEVPKPALSHDGRYLTLTGPEGVVLVDTTTGARTRLPGIARVIGVTSDTVVATTGPKAEPGSFDTSLVVLDHRGTVRSRVPFDPTLDVRLAPDGRSLAVLTHEEVATMDVATGKVTGRHDLTAPDDTWGASMLAWDGGSRLLVVGQESVYLVNPATGKAKPYASVDDGIVVGGSAS